MRLSKSLITKFQQTHVEKFGYAISDDVAEAELLELAELVAIATRNYCPADKEDAKQNED